MVFIELPARGGEGRGYLAVPKAGKGPGVVVIHAWWGLNDFFQDLCERLAGKGFVALAPDLYHGATAKTIAQAKQLRSKLRRAVLTKEITGAVDYLRVMPGAERFKVGVAGLSLGAYWASWLADSKPDDVGALVLFYGIKTPGEARAAVMGHFAGDDDYVRIASVRKLERKLEADGRKASIFVYPGTRHWFFEKDRKEAYNAEAARLAWERSHKFLFTSLKRA